MTICYQTTVQRAAFDPSRSVLFETLFHLHGYAVEYCHCCCHSVSCIQDVVLSIASVYVNIIRASVTVLDTPARANDDINKATTRANGRELEQEQGQGRGRGHSLSVPPRI
jgi:hypothetical protein